MKRKNLITLSAFVFLTLVCIVPALLHGYIYPNMSDDTANHLSVIVRMVNGTLPSFEFRYLGYAVIGYPMYWVSNLFNIEMTTLFNWIHILLPLLIGLVLYFIVNRLVNWIAGLLSLIIPIFLSGASIYYLYYGLIFNSISVLILYPCLIYFMVKWLLSQRKLDIVWVIILAVLTGTFHVSGLYLPFVMIFALVAYVAYSKICKKKICKSKLFLGITIVAIGLVCVLALPYTRQQIIDVVKGLYGGMMVATSESIRVAELYEAVVPLSYYTTTFITIPLMLLLGLCVFQFKVLKEKLNHKTKLFICICGCWGIILLVSAYSGLSTIPLRQQTDFAIVLALIVTILIGVLTVENKKVLIVALIVIVIGLYPQFVPTWFENNSAIRSVDKQTIEYINESGYESYDCSPTVSWAIYDKYLKAKYHSGSDILIIRSEPMTQGSDENNPYYDKHGTYKTNGYSLVKAINDGTIEILIYERAK